MIDQTITAIENWYREPSNDPSRPFLLSKLAILELCGWLEEWMDETIREVDKKTISDQKWIQENLIGLTSGFKYDQHFRSMLIRIIGEHSVRNIEIRFNQTNPGDLEYIKSSLGSLWHVRCQLAHADMAANRRTQTNVQSPSWTKNQYLTISRKLNEFKRTVLTEI